MKKRPLLWIAGGSGLILIVAVGAWYFGQTETGRRWRVFDETFQQEITKSPDLAVDRERMWRTVPCLGQHSSAFEVSPVSAINAASRVFATVDLLGKTADDVSQILGVQPRPKYGYNFPFHSAGKGELVYRFDCGSFGWQFNLVIDIAGKVSKVERQGIE